MKKEDIPQDGSNFGKLQALHYAFEENGNYVTSVSSGWKAINIANDLAWERIKEDLNAILERVRKGELSPLAYHMNSYMLDEKLLSGYVKLSKRKTKQHLKPEVFNRLDNQTLERYASVFNMTVDELKRIP